MKKWCFILFILAVIFLVGCANENAITGKQTSGTGNIYVVGTPLNAGVLVDNAYKGTIGSNGKTISGLSVGNHIVQVKKFNHCTIIRNKYVSAGQTTEMEANLAPKGNLNVQSTPQGADFSVNGVEGYKTPQLVTGLCAGNNILYFFKDGYQTKRADKYVNGGTTTQLSVQLEIEQPVEEEESTSGYNFDIPDVDIADTTQTNIPAVVGNLDSSSTPDGANIFVDGIYKGVTPSIISLSIGSRSVVISKPGYQTYSTTVNIVDGQTTSLGADLQPEVTSIYVLTNPPGVSVSIKRSGENIYTLKGTTQTATDPNYGELTINSDLVSGDYSVKLNKNGYEEKIINVVVTSGQTSTANVILTALPPTTPATLKVNARNANTGTNLGGADVYINYAYKGKTPASAGYSFLTINNVNAGEYTITVKKTNYQDYTMTVNVNAGEIREVITQLTPA